MNRHAGSPPIRVHETELRNVVRTGKEKSVNYSLDVAGLPVNITVTRKELKEVHERLLLGMMRAAELRSGRYVVLLAGPCGSGKSVLAALWERIAADVNPSFQFQVLPEDAFHYSNNYLASHETVRDGKAITLLAIKGASETYDLNALTEALRNLYHRKHDMRWPWYDVRIHDSVPDAIKVNDSGLFIVEGHYMLLDRPGWSQLRSFADASVFLDIQEDTAKKAVIGRHMQSGRSEASSMVHYENSDSVNNRLIREHRLEMGETDITLVVHPDRSISLQDKTVTFLMRE